MFYPREHYRPASPPGGYRFLPFRFMRWPDDEVLLVNDVGESLFLDRATFSDFTARRLDESRPEFFNLKAKHFLNDGPSDIPLELLATKYRTKRAFLDSFTNLHLFIVTLRCDHSCHYCQVSRVTEDRTSFDMTQEAARKAVDLMFRSPAPALKIEFQGGESLLNFDLIRWIVEHVEVRNLSEQRDLSFVVATNLAPLTDDMLAFFRDHSVVLSTSLDGPEWLHNQNRPRKGNDSHALTLRNLARAREVLGHDQVAAVMTTTARSLEHPTHIVDEYVRQGFASIFLRPISPYGFALRTGSAPRYQMDQFLEFYKLALDHIIELNRSGTPFVEIYTQILLRKIMTPFATGYVDLQSPAGTGISVAAYNYDGDVYASDEARMLAAMGDTSFRLGNVHEHSYEELFGGEMLQSLVAGSCLETLPGCSDCAFLPYCGADPVLNWATQRDPVGHRPTSVFCRKNMGIFKHLFSLLRLRDPFIAKLFVSWAAEQPLPC